MFQRFHSLSRTLGNTPETWASTRSSRCQHYQQTMSEIFRMPALLVAQLAYEGKGDPERCIGSGILGNRRVIAV